MNKSGTTNYMKTKISRNFGLWCVLSSWLFVATFRMIPVGGVWGDLNIHVIILLIGWLLIFILSYYLGSYVKIYPKSLIANFDTKTYNTWILLTSVVATIGALLIAFEFAVLRGYGFDTNVALIRAQEAANAEFRVEGSLVSGIGRLMTPAIIVAWNIYILCKDFINPTHRWTLFIATSIVLWQQLSFEGGRFAIAALIISTLFSWIYKTKKYNHTNLNIKFVVISIIAIIFFGYAFLGRAENQSLDLGVFYETFSKHFDIDSSKSFLLNDGKIGPVSFSLVMFWHYLTHSFNEFQVILFHEIDYAGGLYQFPHLGQAASILFDVSLGYNVFAELPNPGTYVTFAGANYVDFGYIGLYISGFVLGTLCGISSNSLRAGILRPLSLTAPLFLTIAIFTPIYSMLPNLWPCFVYFLIVKIYKVNLSK